MGEERFEAWMGEHLGVLHRIARAFAAGADQHDLLQELMLAVWRAAPSFRGQSAPAMAAIILGGALALGAGWMAVKYAAQLAPERRHLDALIRQYETAA